MRLQLGQWNGPLKGGSLDVLCHQQRNLQDPLGTAVLKQARAMHKLLRAWPTNLLGQLKSAGRTSWMRLQDAAGKQLLDPWPP